MIRSICRVVRGIVGSPVREISAHRRAFSTGRVHSRQPYPVISGRFGVGLSSGLFSGFAVVAGAGGSFSNGLVAGASFLFMSMFLSVTFLT